MGAEVNNPNNHLDAVYHILHANGSGGLPTEAQMDNWVTNYGLENATLASKDAAATLTALQKRECTYLVDTNDMTITWKQCSGTNGQGPLSISEGLTQLAAALQ